MAYQSLAPQGLPCDGFCGGPIAEVAAKTRLVRALASNALPAHSYYS